MTTTETPTKLNVTWHAVCPSCGITTTMSGLGADDTPEVRAKLGQVAMETAVRCMGCDEVLTLTCVGVCLAPFVARPEDDDEEPGDDF